jgi:hypothetical protein
MKIIRVEPIILPLPRVSENIDGAQDESLIRGRNGRRREVDRSPAVALAAIEAL